MSFGTTDDDVPVVLTTFGILAYQSDESWSWVCEEVAGNNGISAFLALADGTWLAGTTTGLLVSADRCAWTAVSAFDGQYVTALVADRDDPAAVWATTLTVEGSGALYRSTDAGQSFSVFADFGEGASLRGLKQGADGSLVVLGWLDEAAWLWRSADGAHWEAVALGLEADHSVSLLGLDGRGAAWLRVADGQDFRLTRVDADGGVTEVTVFDHAIVAFDLGPDPDQLLVSIETLGLLSSTDGGQSWSPPDDGPTPLCLVTQGDRRFACTHNWSDDAAVMSAGLDAHDPADLDWTPVLWFGDVRGVLACPAESTTAVICEPLWETVSVSSGLDLQRRGADSGESAGKDSGRCGCGAPARAHPGLVLSVALATMLQRRIARRCPRR